ncbi:hypothetical protein I7I48_07319 [Histoplasma ohiense]|nr:hypothetical protein I7I48_07319 [Histoplasma ohiense (nom. inval.)]
MLRHLSGDHTQRQQPFSLPPRPPHHHRRHRHRHRRRPRPRPRLKLHHITQITPLLMTKRAENLMLHHVIPLTLTSTASPRLCPTRASPV